MRRRIALILAITLGAIARTNALDAILQRGPRNAIKL
jgi:hypothetical protein